MRPVLDGALVEDVQRALQPDDIGRVVQRDRHVRLARAADQLVRAVQAGEHADLDGGAVSAGEGRREHLWP